MPVLGGGGEVEGQLLAFMAAAVMCCLSVCRPPLTLKNVVKTVEKAKDWKTLGHSLSIPYSKLDRIERRHSFTDRVNQCDQMLVV